MKLSILLFVWMTLGMGLYAQENKAFLNNYEKYWKIDDQHYRVMDNGKIGLITADGSIIVPADYDQVWNLQENGNIKVMRNGKLGIYNVEGGIVIPTEYEMIWNFENGIARVMRNGKIGYVNQNGNEFIACDYDQIWSFKDGKAKVLKDGKVGYISQNGTELIPVEYQNIWGFDDGLAKVLKNGKIGMIDEKGMEVIPCLYQQIYGFNNDGISRAVLHNDIVYIDKTGNLLPDYQPENTPLVNTVKNTEKSQSNTMIVNVEDGDTTVINLLGNKVTVVKNGNSKEYSFDSNNIEKEWTKHKEKQKRKFTGHYWGAELGFNNYLNADYKLSMPDGYDFLELNQGKSVEFSMNLLQGSLSLSRSGTVGFVTGAGLTFNNYRFANPTIPVKDENGMLSYETIDGSLNKNKLTTLYLTVPVLFECQFNRHNRDGFYMSAGMIGGYRLKSYTKVVTMDSGNKDKDKNRSSFNLNSFRYGAQFRFGFESINFYGTYWLNPMFDTDKGPELYPVSVGVAIYPSWW